MSSLHGLENAKLTTIAPDMVNASISWYDYEEEEEEVEEDYVDIERFMHILSMVFYSIAFLLGVTGNGLVIWITGFKMKKTVNTVWFLNLAIADFIFTFFLPLSIAYTALGFHWPFGMLLCKLNSFVAFLNMFASVLILMVISIDRCLSAASPVWSQNHRSAKLASIVALVVWCLALALSSPYLAFRDTRSSYNVYRNSTVIHCYNNFAFSDDNKSEYVQYLKAVRHKAMIITRFVCGFFIPFIVIIVCYSIIALRLKKNRLAKTSKPFKIIIAVIVSFFFCWLPYHVFSFLETTTHSSPSPGMIRAITIGIPLASSLAFLNSCINPILYVFMGQDFKEKFKRSILSAFESAFSEESAQTSISKNKCKSISDAETHFN
ncbi:chemokine-like receptor 1 [Rhinatrema bivittatum]|uniref:chemokine-like receptor 1 n=1 Tax=Rhinatrema bivittatum TaxID=194408 RepID=UPI00112D9B75|nr:chemokine-like receptor 1 [Rhinatrema bivittatum]XP_029433249.1 chemokine-like receptor 1 [Rhinatrema bivittatum]